VLVSCDAAVFFWGNGGGEKKVPSVFSSFAGGGINKSNKRAIDMCKMVFGKKESNVKRKKTTREITLRKLKKGGKWITFKFLKLTHNLFNSYKLYILSQN